MASRFMQLQTEAAYSSRSSRTSSPHRPQPQTTSNYSQRTSTSSDSSTSTNGSYYEPRINIDSAPRVEVLRCSRCAKCVETISAGRKGDDLRRVSTEDASANGMVRFGHNLYYCDRCARMVGYK